MAKPNRAIAAAMAAETLTKPTTSLEKIEVAASRARDLEKEIEDLQNTLKEKNVELYGLYHVTLPDLMVEASVDHIGLPAKGNLPAVDAELKPYYSANIAASWPEERRAAAFEYLIKLKAGDLIKTDVIASYGRGKVQDARKLAQSLAKKKGVSAVMKQAVHANTLTAWLKESVERNNFTPNLELIGGAVGSVVKLKARKDD